MKAPPLWTAVPVGFLVALAIPHHQEPISTRLDSYTRCYANEMLLSPLWQIDIVYLEPDSLRDYEAATEADPKYRFATVSYDTVWLATYPDSMIRGVVVHELSHIWSWELAAMAEDTPEEEAQGLVLDEQQATFVSRWPVWQRLCR